MHITIVILGIIVSSLISWVQLKSKNVKGKDICTILALQTIGLVAGSKLLDLIMNFDAHKNQDFITNINAGYMFYGGFLLAMLLVAVYTKRKKIENVNLIVFNNIVVLYAIWKIGCFVSGCCSGISNFPLQITETIICFAIYVGLNLIKKSEYILTIFGIERYLSIILRDRIDIGDLIVNILISSCLIVITLAINIRKNKLNARN